MKKLLTGLFLGAILLISAPQANAHSLWVNLFESYAHHPGHFLVTLGWGHCIPLDDLLASSHGAIKVQAYDLIDPKNNKVSLGIPKIEKPKLQKLKTGLNLQKGELGIRKLGLTSKTEPGTYQVVTETEATYFTVFLNQKGKTAWVAKSMDQVKNAKKILNGLKYKSYGKAYATIKKWTQPKAAGHDLELLPKTDLSKVRKGDLVKIQCSFMGKQLSTNANNMVFMTLTSNTFGGPDGFTLSSPLSGGIAKFRIPTAGQWLCNIYYSQDVAKVPSLKGELKKCQKVMYGSSLTFNVKP